MYNFSLSVIKTALIFFLFGQKKVPPEMGHSDFFHNQI